MKSVSTPAKSGKKKSARNSKPQTPPPPPPAAEQDEFDWFQHLGDLTAMASKRLPASHPSRQELEIVERHYSFEQLAESPALCRRVVEAFYRETTPADQRRVLAGWQPIPKRPAKSQVLAHAREQATVEHVVEVAYYGKPIAFHSWLALEYRTPVRVVVQAGATREEVMSELRKLVQFVDDQFESFHEGEPEPFPKEIPRRLYFPSE